MAVTFFSLREGDDNAAVILTNEALVKTFLTNEDYDEIDGRLDELEENGGGSGEPGADGKDGITPHIGLNGNWFIGETDTGMPSRGEKGDTGATGPAGAAGAKGDKGDKGDSGETGPAGAAGKDYILTDADKTEIANIVKSEGIPEYWQTTLDDGVEAINAALETAGRNKSAFLWYTDAHWGYGSGMSPKLLAYLHLRTAMNKTNYGGDFGNNYATSEKTEEEWLATMREYKLAVRELPNHHSVIGNHDYNGGNGNIPYLSEHLYGFVMAPEETTDIARGGDYYYYIDEPNEKTRYLYLNTSFCWSLTNTGEEGQGQFVADALASTPDGWHIVAISHIWFLYADTSTPTVGDVPIYCKALLNLFDAYNNRGSGTITIGSESVVYNFADTQAQVEFCIGGHTHVDYDFASDGGIPVLLTATDSYHLRGSTLDPRNLPGTTDEASVSGIIADYNNRKIHVVRIGRGESRVVEITNFVATYTNVLDTVGYAKNKYISASSGYAEKDKDGVDLTGYIAVKHGDIIRLKNVTMPDVSNYSNSVYFFDSSKVGKASAYITSTSTNGFNAVYKGGNLVQFTVLGKHMGWDGGAESDVTGFIRIGAANIDSSSIITINEEIG